MEKMFAWAYVAGVAWLLCWEISAFAVNVDYTLSRIWWRVEGTGFTIVRYATFAVLFGLAIHLAFGVIRVSVRGH